MHACRKDTEHRLWGDATLGYHLVNVLLHAMGACLLVALMHRLLLPGAWLAGLVFALHPVHVESVAWITEQKNTLSLVFYLLAALAYLRFDGDRQGRAYGLATGLFVLALLTKSVTATLPAALLVVFWWQRGRLQWRRDVGPLLPWFALGAGGGLFTAWVERTFIGAEGAAFDLSWLQRCLLAGRAGWFYLAKLFWPAELSFTYPRWTIDAAAPWQYLYPVGLMALAAGLFWARGRGRGPLAGLLVFGGSLFPVLGFFYVFPFRYSYVADHFQYLASLGIIVPVAATVAAALERTREPGRRRAGQLLLALLVACLGGLTWRQSGLYRDAETLYRATLVRNPSSWFIHNNLGNLLNLSPSTRSEAIVHLETAVKLNPTSEVVHSNLAAMLSEVGRPVEAMRHLEQSIQLNPANAVSHYNLGVILLDQPGRMADARAQFEAAVRINPRIAQAQYDYGLTLVDVPGRLPEAIAHYEEALRLQPNYSRAQNNLGVALMKIPGRQAEAIAHYEAALRLEPANADTHFNLAMALLAQPGRLAQAIAHLEAVLRLQPTDAEAHNQLGEALLRAGRSLEARTHFETAVRLQPEYRAARDNLAKITKAGN